MISAWPPNCLRIAESNWSAKSASPREVKRSKRAALSTALYERFASRNEDEFANRLLSAMRKQFGGHDEKPAGAGA